MNECSIDREDTLYSTYVLLAAFAANSLSGTQFRRWDGILFENGSQPGLQYQFASMKDLGHDLAVILAA